MFKWLYIHLSIIRTPRQYFPFLTPTISSSILIIIIIFKFYLFYFWLRWVFVAARGLFSGCGEQGLLFVAVRGLLIVVASLVGSTGSRRTGFSSCGMWAQ